MWAVRIPRLEGGSIGPGTESWVNWDGHMGMIPCLHQGNIYTKRKLRVWRDLKCIPLAGAITPLNCAGRQNTPSRVRQYRAQNGKLNNCDGPISMVPCLHQKNMYTNRKLRVWRDQKCIPLVAAINPLYLCGPSKYPVSREAV